jgi:hypothetical protein
VDGFREAAAAVSERGSEMGVVAAWSARESLLEIDGDRCDARALRSLLDVETASSG